MLQAISGLEGFAIEASDGRMGTVVDFLFDDALWRVRWLVVDCGSWLSGRKVVIPPAAVSYTALEDEEFNVELTKEQVQGSPELLGHQPVSRQMEGRLYEYYGWDRLPGEAEAAVSRSDDERLHGVAEVMGYRVHAIDGEIGHVENFLFDDQDWSFRYLIVDTSQWWFGKQVLISPHAVKAIDGSNRQVRLDVSRKQVEASPPWDPLVAFDEIYATRLHDHYGWPGSRA